MLLRGCFIKYLAKTIDQFNKLMYSFLMPKKTKNPVETDSY